MPHNIEVHENGQAAFVSARVPAWHTLGTVTDDALTAIEAGKIALLNDWNVRTEPLLVQSVPAFEPCLINVPDHYATVRTNPVTGFVDVLGVVGNRYQPIQNEEAFDVLDAIVDESGAHFETAGSLDGGKRVFMSMKMPEGLQIAGQDPHDVYLLAYNSHDGSSAFTLAVTPVRVVCQNTLTMGLAAAKQSFTMRHTTSATGKIQEAREALKLTFNYVDEFQKELNAMLDQEMTDGAFFGIVESLLPINKDAGEGWQNRARQQRATLAGLYHRAETNEFGRGTKYAAYNAITEYADWFTTIRGADPQGTRRAERAMATTSSIQTFKNRGLVLVRSA